MSGVAPGPVIPTPPPQRFSGTTFQAFPKLSAPFVNADGTVHSAWYRFLITLWNKAGAAASQASAIYLQLTGTAPAQLLSAFQAVTGDFLGNLLVAGTPGLPGVPQSLTANPFVFTADTEGTLIVFSGQLEVFRAGVWYMVGLTGGALPLLVGDAARITWFGTNAPNTVWLPTRAASTS